MKELAFLWLGVVIGALIYYGCKHTNRHFWLGVGYGVLLLIGCLLTGWAMGKLRAYRNASPIGLSAPNTTNRCRG
jgi:hypothetical protein